jgi:hypothetical protein
MGSFSTPELTFSHQIAPNTTFQKFSMCHPWPGVDAKVGHFLSKCLTFRFALVSHPGFTSKLHLLAEKEGNSKER